MNRKIKRLEKRVANLERSQLQAMKMVKNYIEDQECMSNKMFEMLKRLPENLQRILANNCSDK